jgi:hypothetical protein
MQKALELFNKCNKKVCTQTLLFFWGAECMSQCSCPRRGQECSWADHPKWLQVWCFCGE